MPDSLVPSDYNVNISIDQKSSLYLGLTLGVSIILGIVIGVLISKTA
jgi:hypothetical protein